MSSFGGSQSVGGHSHYNTPSIEFDEGSEPDVKEEPLQQQDQFQQTSMMDALSSNPMLTTASMPIPSRNAGNGHQRAMVGVVSDLDFASEMMDHQFRPGQLHDTVTIENGALVGSGGGVTSFQMNGGASVGGVGVGGLPQIDTLYAIPNGWESMVLTSDGIDFGAMNVPGLQMMDTWAYVSPSSTASSVTPNDAGQLQDTTTLTMTTQTGAMSGGGQTSIGQQMMDEFYPLDDFGDGLLCNDLNTIEGLFHDDITLLGQPLSHQSPNLSGDSGIMPSSLPQQLLGRSGGQLLAGGMMLTNENTAGSVGSNSVSSGFGVAEGGGIQLLLSSDPMVAASYLNTNSNSNILLYDEQTRISASPFEVYTKQEPGSAQLLMNNTNERLIGSNQHQLLGQSVPSGSGLLSPGPYSGRRVLQGHHSAAAAAAAAAGAVSVGSSAGTSGTSSMSRLSSSAPTHISGFEQIWQRREPRPHLLSTGSLAEATGSTSSLSTGSVLSPEAPDYSHDEGYSDDSDHYEDYSSGEDSDSEDTGKVSTSAGSSKAKRYFWQYNVQAKGPKGQRLVIKTQAEDPHVLNAVTDPVFSPHCSVRGIKHSGKARKGDGNDLTPNPRKLHNIGKELDKLGRVINDMKPVSELPFNARPKTRKEKNKLASRACRLKKKAQHEANKIKLYGLETEHRRLMNGIFQLKQILVAKCNNAGTPTDNPEEYKQQLDTLVQTSSKIKIAGNSTEFVNKMLENVRTGNNTSIDTVLEHF
uniref:Uncharacterized protein n=1 Tax=Anopheles atroparvus TaxID=41427 RepID=A0A182JF22_ANOAO